MRVLYCTHSWLHWSVLDDVINLLSSDDRTNVVRLYEVSLGKRRRKSESMNEIWLDCVKGYLLWVSGTKYCVP